MIYVSYSLFFPVTIVSYLNLCCCLKYPVEMEVIEEEKTKIGIGQTL